MEEVWKSLPFIYECIDGVPAYEVSNLGNVRKLRRYQNGTKKYITIRQHHNKYGQLVVNLNRLRGSGTSKTVYMLVATAFVENPYNFCYVRHKDGNLHNNTASNLEWCSYQDSSSEKTKLERGNSTSKFVRQYTMDGKFVAEFRSVSEAARAVGVRVTSIGNCCHSRIKSCAGYVWRFAEE